MAFTAYYTTGEIPRVMVATLESDRYHLEMHSQNLAKRQKANTARESQITLDVLPEIAILNREIERFKRSMLQKPGHEEEDSYRAVAERHFLNGLERAREVLILSCLEGLER